MRHVNHITAQHVVLAASQEAGQHAVDAVRGDRRSDRLRARLTAWSPYRRPAFNRPATRSRAVDMRMALKRQPATAGGLGSPRRKPRLALPLCGSSAVACGCPAGSL